MGSFRFDTVLGQVRDNDRNPVKHEYLTQRYIQTIDDLLEYSTDLGFFATTNSNHLQLENTVYVIDASLDITGYTLCFGAKTQINGLGQNVSQIVSGTYGADVNNKYVFFKSSANLFMNDLEIVCNGHNQRVWEHIGDGVTVPEGESFELNRFNLLSFPAGGPVGHNNELGLIKDIRQGFIGTFSCFGFNDGFRMAGAWAGGMRIISVLVRVFNLGKIFYSDPLDPVSFQLRFFSDANLSVPTGVIGYDFPETAFTFKGQYQLQGGNVSGDGTYVSDFTSGFPAFDPIANFRNNTGIQDTYQGGEWVNSVNTDTVINTVNVWELLNVVTYNKFLTWFTEANGEFTYNGGTPLDITIFLTVSMTGKANDIIEVRLVKEDALGATTVISTRAITIKGTEAQGRAESVPIITTEQLIEGDKIYAEIRNTSGNSNVTTLSDSNCVIGAK
jgi:hypothetical protein